MTPRRPLGQKLASYVLGACLGAFALAAAVHAAPPKADRVLGQANFRTHNPPGAPAPDLPFAPTSLNGPGGVTISPVSGKLFVADFFNKRVTRYSTAAALASGAPAEDSVATSTSGAWSIFVDARDALWIADTAGFVSRFDAASTATLSTATASSTLIAPGCEYLFVDARDTLWVTYGANSPTVTWLALTSGFTSTTPISPSWTGTLKFTNKPELGGITVATKSTKKTNLWVADAKNNKVYRFDNPKNNQSEKNAAAVLGQPKASSTGPRSGPAGLSYPRSLFVDKKGSLWVADTANDKGAKSASRVLRWDNAAKAQTGANAAAIIGQTSYTTKLTGTSATLIAPFRGGISLDPMGKVWLADDFNNRVLRFKRVPKLSTDFAGLVDIGGGRKIYMESRGSGSPTVVLVSGTRGAYDDWTHVIDSTGAGGVPKPSETTVFPQVARLTRVCAYDRPGTARNDDTPTKSSPVQQPTTAQQGVADLHALLAAAKEPGPYVLVGHSWGGLIARIFASTYPNEVSGLVLVDPASEFLKSSLTPEQWATYIKATKKLIEPGGLEAPDHERSLDLLRDTPRLRAIPVVVLTSDKRFDFGAGGAETWPAWRTAQDRLAKLLNARHISDTNSGHVIQMEQPQLVIDAIRDVIDAVRASKGSEDSGDRSHQ